MNKKNLTARDVMAKPLIYVNTEDTMKRAAGVLLDHRISGVPVLDLLERPVGVLTKTDIARYERERSVFFIKERGKAPRAGETGEPVERDKGFQEEGEEDLVSQWMMPNVYSIDADAPLEEVTDKMLRRHVHRLFVNEPGSKKLLGVITTFDILKIFGERLRAGKRDKPVKVALH